MKYKLKLTDFLPLKLANSANSILAKFASENFFPKGEGGLAQVIRDFVTGQTRSNGELHLGLANPDADYGLEKDRLHDTYLSNPTEATNKEILDLLHQKYGTKAELLIKAHSQLALALFSAIPFAIPTADEIKILQPENQDKFADLEMIDGKLFLKYRVDKLPIKSTIQDDLNGYRLNEVIGYINGPAEALLQIRQDNKGAAGFEIVKVTTDNPDIYLMMQGQMFEEHFIKEKYCNHPKKEAAIADLAKNCDKYLSVLDKQISSLPALPTFNIHKETNAFIKVLDAKALQEPDVMVRDLFARVKAEIRAAQVNSGSDEAFYKQMQNVLNNSEFAKSEKLKFPSALVEAVNQREGYQAQQIVLQKYKLVKELETILNDKALDKQQLNKIQQASDFVNKNHAIFSVNLTQTDQNFLKSVSKILQGVQKNYPALRVEDNAGARQKQQKSIFNSFTQLWKSSQSNNNNVSKPTSPAKSTEQKRSPK